MFHELMLGERPVQGLYTVVIGTVNGFLIVMFYFITLFGVLKFKNEILSWVYSINLLVAVMHSFSEA